MALERIFASFKEGGFDRGGYDPADPESYSDYVSALIRDSRDYEGSVLAGARDQAQKYYYGYLPSLNPDGSPYTDNQIIQDPNATYEQILGYDQESANKSSFVSTDVRDAVMLTLPSLIRLFAASENVVALVPRNPADVDAAAQQTNYINYVFWQDNPGFLILYGAFKDAMTVKTGFVKWWTDDHKETRSKTYVNIGPQQIALLSQQDQTARVVHQGPLDPLTGTFEEVTFEYQVDKPLIKVAGVPPEEMRLDRYARSFQTSRLVGHQRIVLVDELTAMGYEREQCMDYLQSQNINEFTQEAQIRNPGRAMSTRVNDGVLYGEWYIKIDKDGDGIAELRYICTMGEDHEIVHDVPANRIKFALFSVDPISHTIVGDSLADYTQDIQRIKTNMWRGVLDSLAESINPKTVVNELTTNLDDALNDDLGAVIRTRGDPRTAVSFSQTPFAGQQAIPVFDLLNDVLARRTGLTDAAKGLDPKALQSSTQIGVDAIINGAQERIELLARVLAETGFKDLFTGLYNEIAEAPNQRRTVRINGSWTDIDTGAFDASMGVEVNSTLGKGSDVIRMATLQQIKQTQEMIMQQFGPTNPVVSIQEYINTITDQLALANIKNVGRYFKTPSPQVLQAIASTPKEPDAMTVAAKAQFEKVKSETAQALGDQQLRQQKQAQDDAFRHEKLRQDALLAEQKLEIERAKAHAQVLNSVGSDDSGTVDPVEAAKVGVDLHKAHLDAAMHDRELQMNFITNQMKISQAREAAALQAQASASSAAAQKQNDGGGS
jgi:hypothetical protein